MKLNNNTKILFTDMDGTLLKDDATISEQTRNVIYNMTARGHKFVLSSGRALPNIIKTKNDLGLDMPGVYISASNGTLIYECDTQKVIFEERLSIDDVRNIWPLALEKGIHIQTYTDDSLVVKKRDRETDFYMIKCPLNLIESSEPWNILPKPPVKMLCIDLDNHDKLDAFGKEVALKYPHLTTCFSSNTYLEIFSNKAGKGNSLLWLCDYLNIPVENSYAAGDAYNDVSMLQAAGTGLAMCNGDPQIFEFADEISEFNNNSEGLSQYIVKEIL